MLADAASEPLTFCFAGQQLLSNVSIGWAQKVASVRLRMITNALLALVLSGQ